MKPPQASKIWGRKRAELGLRNETGGFVEGKKDHRTRITKQGNHTYTCTESVRTERDREGNREGKETMWSIERERERAFGLVCVGLVFLFLKGRNRAKDD